MTELVCGDDPEPAERFPAGPLFVPVRPGPFGYAARLFRTPLGGRTAVGFTSERALAATLGADQPWIRLAEPALRAMTAPLGAATVTVDPQLTAPAPATVPARQRGGDAQTVGVLRVTGAAALVTALSYWIG
ncbi:SAV_915 family protein [Streptomyces sp. NPDC046716]|uniref:SAV_915 family protein n=1 Tax=Streptomyces sp. NPDC046716 TaxID=3157093 RepID=UPI0033F41EDB